jgi:tRNA(His) 5'-end guanylyltransferase
MDNDAFEKQMRSLEYFHTLRLLPGAWVVLRVDGRGFSRFTESRFEKPFDLEFHRVMVQTASALLEELYGIYAIQKAMKSLCYFLQAGTCLTAAWKKLYQ